MTFSVFQILALLEKQVDPLRTKLVYTEDDLQELEAQDERDAGGERTAPVATRSNLLAADYGRSVSSLFYVLLRRIGRGGHVVLVHGPPEAG